MIRQDINLNIDIYVKPIKGSLFYYRINKFFNVLDKEMSVLLEEAFNDYKNTLDISKKQSHIKFRNTDPKIPTVRIEGGIVVGEVYNKDLVESGLLAGLIKAGFSDIRIEDNSFYEEITEIIRRLR